MVPTLPAQSSNMLDGAHDFMIATLRKDSPFSTSRLKLTLWPVSCFERPFYITFSDACFKVIERPFVLLLKTSQTTYNCHLLLKTDSLASLTKASTKTSSKSQVSGNKILYLLHLTYIHNIGRPIIYINSKNEWDTGHRL